MERRYKVAGHCFGVSGEKLCKAVEYIEGFAPFETNETDTLFTFVEGNNAPEIQNIQYRSTYEDITAIFGRTDNGYKLTLSLVDEDALQLWCNDGENIVYICNNYEARHLRFAMLSLRALRNADTSYLLSIKSFSSPYPPRFLDFSFR